MTNAAFFFAPVSGVSSETFFEYFTASLRANRRHFVRTLLYVPANAVVPALPDIDDVVRMSSRHRHYPHYMRVLSWLEYLRSPLFNSDSVLLDADIVLNRSLADVFDRDFALALNAAPSKQSWSFISAAMILARHARRADVLRYMEQVAAIAERLKWEVDPRYPDVRCSGVWGLDELCLAEFVGEPGQAMANEIGPDEFKPLRDGVSLFGNAFNKDARHIPREEWGNARAVHFVAQAKSWLVPYVSISSI